MDYGKTWETLPEIQGSDSSRVQGPVLLGNDRQGKIQGEEQSYGKSSSPNKVKGA